MTKSVSAKAVARSYRTERALTLTVGVLALLLGAGVSALGLGWFGTYRAQRPVLDPIALDWLGRQQPTVLRVLVIVVGVVLLGFGLWWFVRSLSPERHPNIELDRGEGTSLTVTSGAVTHAIEADAERIDGVDRARVHVVGDREDPALRLHLWLREGTDLRQVWADVDDSVLTRAREALGVRTLPTAVRLELGAARRQRVR
ncbi:hypothetical protein BAY61_05555 [Prauserella marina]|uniref:Uncharacterized protein n=1 Tax=Prauserella marina TaxID=530584 RepID=A0A222VKY3_9PSEU|nr:alkaline shock response membrane anchor protein AmaP [Prauserella marina]ASR34544.1 hypothetical protein BAY61_05555 [Prauserella marina]PWV85847.1 hypothetical protein DES30_1011877 [Prauserella marina]SDC44042.1 hypothetical protein SAMN05421630_102115 [Prauserella marina]